MAIFKRGSSEKDLSKIEGDLNYQSIFSSLSINMDFSDKTVTSPLLDSLGHSLDTFTPTMDLKKRTLVIRGALYWENIESTYNKAGSNQAYLHKDSTV